MVLRSLLILCLIQSSLSCKEKTGSKSAVLGEVGIPADSARSVIPSDEFKKASEMYRLIVNYPYEVRLAKAPTSANARRKPRSGNWYPERVPGRAKGGTNVDGALDKYVSVFGGDAASWEQEHHADNDTGYSGHCNGHAVSSLRNEEPPSGVNVTRYTPDGTPVVFTPTDLKALDTEIGMSAKTLRMAGNRCDRDDSKRNNPFQREDPEQMSECEDVNPAAMFLAFINWMGGPERLPLILDFSWNEEVWNYVAYGYECTNCKIGQPDPWVRITDEQAVRYIGGSGEYRFNRAKASLAYVELLIRYAEPSDREMLGRTIEKTKSLKFVLELNSRDEIIGGEWHRDSRDDHPDHVAFPLESSGGDGETGAFANPDINPDHVRGLYREAHRLAGNFRPYEGKKDPRWRTDWGDYHNFIVTLNGYANGVVFAGGRTRLEVKLLDEHFEGHRVEVILNGERVRELNPALGSVATHEFDALRGRNTLRLEWKGPRAIPVDLDFMVMQ